MYLVFIVFNLLEFNASPSLHIHITPLFHVEMEKDGWE